MAHGAFGTSPLKGHRINKEKKNMGGKHTIQSDLWSFRHFLPERLRGTRYQSTGASPFRR
jgi:hypothetical protein